MTHLPPARPLADLCRPLVRPGQGSLDAQQVQKRLPTPFQLPDSPKFIARRMVIFASEDVGNADPLALLVATAVFHAVEVVGLPEAQINLAQGTTYLATRPKDNASYAGLLEALKDAQAHGNLAVPLHLRNAVTSLMRDLGYGKGYRYVHEDAAAKGEQEHLPPPLKGKRYYRPKGS